MTQIMIEIKTEIGAVKETLMIDAAVIIGLTRQGEIAAVPELEIGEIGAAQS